MKRLISCLLSLCIFTAALLLPVGAVSAAVSDESKQYASTSYGYEKYRIFVESGKRPMCMTQGQDFITYERLARAGVMTQFNDVNNRYPHYSYSFTYPSKDSSDSTAVLDIFPDLNVFEKYIALYNEVSADVLKGSHDMRSVEGKYGDGKGKGFYIKKDGLIYIYSSERLYGIAFTHNGMGYFFTFSNSLDDFKEGAFVLNFQDSRTAAKALEAWEKDIDRGYPIHLEALFNIKTTKNIAHPIPLKEEKKDGQTYTDYDYKAYRRLLKPDTIGGVKRLERNDVFIPFEGLPGIGKFVKFTTIQDEPSHGYYDPKKLWRYQYTLQDEKGNADWNLRVALDMSYDLSQGINATPVTLDDVKDPAYMDRLKAGTYEKSYSKLCIGNLVYIYNNYPANGNYEPVLEFVTFWETKYGYSNNPRYDNYLISYNGKNRGDYGLFPEKNEAGKKFAAFLNSETAEKAAAAFLEDLKPRVKTETSSSARKLQTVIGISATLLLAVVIIGIPLVVSRRKKKKAADGVENEGESTAGNDPGALDAPEMPPAPADAPGVPDAPPDSPAPPRDTSK